MQSTRPPSALRSHSTRSRRRSSAAAKPIATRRVWPTSCTRSAPTARGSPAISMPQSRARTRSKLRTARSRAGLTWRSAPSAPYWRRPTSEATAFKTPDGAFAAGPAMAHVIVTINGRQYRLACEDGEEAHLSRLAADLDRRIETLRERHGEIGDARLTIMAALTIADEVVEAGTKLRKAEAELAAMADTRTAAAERAKVTQTAVSAALNAAAERIESITRRLNETVSNGGIAMG